MVEIELLVPNLKSSLNAPGESFFEATASEWVAALANAFWWGRMKGFFTDWRTDADGENIVPAESGGEEIPMELAQIVVAIASLNALEAKLLSLETKSVATAGPVSYEVGRSAQVLSELLKQKRAEFNLLKAELVGTNLGAYGSIIDMVLSREGAYMSGTAAWVG